MQLKPPALDLSQLFLLNTPFPKSHMSSMLLQHHLLAKWQVVMSPTGAVALLQAQWAPEPSCPASDTLALPNYAIPM